MFKLTDIGNSTKSEAVSFNPGDVIHLWEDAGYVHLQVLREDTTILIGKDRDMSFFFKGMTVQQVWGVLQVLLKAEWIIAEVTTEEEASIAATIHCVAFSYEDMLPFLR